MAFNHDGTRIVSACDGGIGGHPWGGTIKVWDAANFPFNASEWEKVEGDGEDDYDYKAQMEYPYWKNTVTGDLRQEESTAGVSPSNRSKSGMQVLQPAQLRPSPSLTTHPSILQDPWSSRRRRRARTGCASSPLPSTVMELRSSPALGTGRSKSGMQVPQPAQSLA